MPRPDEPIPNVLIGHAALPVEQVGDDAITLSGVKPMPVISVFAPTHTVELVEHAELLVEQRALGQGLLPCQVGAVARHAHNEVLGALVLVDDLIPVPRRDDGVFHARLALGPLEAVLAMSILGSVLGRERPHVVRNAEGDEALDLCGVALEERVETPLVLENGLEFLEMELVVDGAVVASLEPAEEALLAKALHHVDVALVTLGARALEAL